MEKYHRISQTNKSKNIIKNKKQTLESNSERNLNFF